MKKVHSPLVNRLLTRIIIPAIAIAGFLLGTLFIGMQNFTVSAQKGETLKNPTELVNKPNPIRGGDVNFDLNIIYGDNMIPDPATGTSDAVHLRSYNGELVGPTMRVRPGQLLRIFLNNLLPADDPSCKSNEDMDIPHCYNSTNLHTHGWHVSPTGNSDNVLLDLGPQTSLDYEYYLPKDHPAGTFWYHSHRHGSTALQVSSGMAGALIVEGFRQLKDKAQNGIADIDTILHDTNGERFKDRIFMFEQIQYYCGFNPDGSANYDCSKKGDVGVIDSYAQFGPGTWGPSGRFTLINGQLQPVIEMQAGQIERWRLIHGGVRDTINFAITKAALTDNSRQGLDDMLAKLKKMPPAQQNSTLAQICADKDIPRNGVKQLEFAVDGLTRKQMSAKYMNILQPGYRSDLLMSFASPGIYCVLDATTSASGSINGINPPAAAPAGALRAAAPTTNINDTRLLSLVFVSGGTPYSIDPTEYTSQQLRAANQDLPAPVLEDLKTLSVPEYVPHKDVAPSEVTGKQELSFAIRTASDGSNLFQIANEDKPTQLDFYSYQADRIDRVLTLGGVDEWTLTSGSIGHPFHIHVNPFQIIQILRPDGKPVVDAKGKCVDFDDKGVLDPEYCDQIGVWRDTLFIKNPNFDPTGLSKGYTITMRTRYERYIGDFVLHCHILDHEDQGMMQNVRIAPKGGYLEGNPVPTKAPEGAMNHGHH